MNLAKQHIDIGLFTDNGTPMVEFWQREVGLPFEETLPLGGGVLQHRHAMNGSVLKLNASREPLRSHPASGYRELLIAREGIRAPRELVDPDGNRITLVPPGYYEMTGIALRLAVRDVEAFHGFYGTALQLSPDGKCRYRCGDSIIEFAGDDTAQRTEALRARGFRYITVQVHDVDGEHAGIVGRGGEEGRPPVTLGETARISFVRDPDGNWIEVSQRASLTGPLDSSTTR